MMDTQLFNWPVYGYSVYGMLMFAIVGWLFSLTTKKVSHVDIMWSLFFVIAGYTVALLLYDLSTRGAVVLTLLTVWAVRLSAHIAVRGWGHEDHRYQTIRRNNEPFFWFKSLYIVFILQAVLAWIVSLSLYGALDGDVPFFALDYLATLLVLFGLYWEVVGDWQLTQFKAKPENAGKVLDTGLWRYTRHPNYFGECCVWWGFYLFALAAGAWWALISPVVMTLLLLKVSGVSLLESTISERRPAYLAYIQRTNAFIPGAPKHADD
jgi:steroid 5-alpha reductase family enzyme